MPVGSVVSCMSAPSYVPVDPADDPRRYTSEWRRPEPWEPDRPGEIVGIPQPTGGLFGNQGPDIGYAYRLFRLVVDRLHLAPGESLHDVEVGVVAVAMKRASMFGRAPILADLELACTVWGFFDEQPPGALAAKRRKMFEGAGHHGGYPLIREIAAIVPEETLRLTLAQVSSKHAGAWSSLLSLQ